MTKGYYLASLISHPFCFVLFSSLLFSLLNWIFLVLKSIFLFQEISLLVYFSWMIHHILQMTMTHWLILESIKNPEGEGRKKLRSIFFVFFFFFFFASWFLTFLFQLFFFFSFVLNPNQLASSPLDCLGISFLDHLEIHFFCYWSVEWVRCASSFPLLLSFQDLIQFTVLPNTPLFHFKKGWFTVFFQEWWKKSNCTLHFIVADFLFQQLFTRLMNEWMDGPMNQIGKLFRVRKVLSFSFFLSFTFIRTFFLGQYFLKIFRAWANSPSFSHTTVCFLSFPFLFEWFPSFKKQPVFFFFFFLLSSFFLFF